MSGMFRTPRQLPHWETMLGDVPASPSHVAKHLGLSARTIARYTAAGQAPRPVVLALFWETRWGISTAETTAENAMNEMQRWTLGAIFAALAALTVITKMLA